MASITFAHLNDAGKIVVDKEVSQTLTSDCWPVQMHGLGQCKNCEFKDTEDCGGGETLKKLLAEVNRG